MYFFLGIFPLEDSSPSHYLFFIPQNKVGRLLPTESDNGELGRLRNGDVRANSSSANLLISGAELGFSPNSSEIFDHELVKF